MLLRRLARADVNRHGVDPRWSGDSRVRPSDQSRLRQSVDERDTCNRRAHVPSRSALAQHVPPLQRAGACTEAPNFCSWPAAKGKFAPSTSPSGARSKPLRRPVRGSTSSPGIRHSIISMCLTPGAPLYRYFVFQRATNSPRYLHFLPPGVLTSSPPMATTWPTSVIRCMAAFSRYRVRSDPSWRPSAASCCLKKDPRLLGGADSATHRSKQPTDAGRIAAASYDLATGTMFQAETVQLASSADRSDGRTHQNLGAGHV